MRAINCNGAIVMYGLSIVVLHCRCHVVLGMDGNHLRALGVVHRDFVVAATAFGAIGFQAAHHRARWERKWRHALGMVDTTDDDGLVRIAFQEIDDDFLTDAGNADSPPAFAGPRVRDANPAGRILVVLAQPVPVKLHFYASEFFGINFLAGRTHDHGRLTSLHARFRSHAQGTERDVGRDTFEGIRIEEALVATTRTIRLAHGALMIDSGQHPLLVHVLAIVIGYIDGRPGGKVAAVGFS